MEKFLAILLVMVLVASMGASAFAASKTVYVTSTGKVYHEKECPNTWNGRYSTTIEECQKLKLEPCPYCEPPEYDEYDPDNNSLYVAVLMDGDYYHYYDCDLLWTDDEWYGTSMTLKTAQKHDLKACGLCHPDEGAQSSTVYQTREDGAYHTCDCSIIWRARFKTTMAKLDEDARPCAYCHDFGY